MDEKLIEEARKQYYEGMRNVAFNDRVIDCRFAIGDTVRLRSSCQIMTIVGYPDTTGVVECMYFTRESASTTIKIHQNCLKRVGWWGRFWNTF